MKNFDFVVAGGGIAGSGILAQSSRDGQELAAHRRH